MTLQSPITDRIGMNNMLYWVKQRTMLGLKSYGAGIQTYVQAKHAPVTRLPIIFVLFSNILVLA